MLPLHQAVPLAAARLDPATFARWKRGLTAELARLDLPMLVIYGEDDNAWSPAAQETMAQRLGARRLCIPAAMHSPAVEAPATTASALTQFWDAAEATPPAYHPAATTRIA